MLEPPGYKIFIVNLPLKHSLTLVHLLSVFFGTCLLILRPQNCFSLKFKLSPSKKNYLSKSINLLNAFLEFGAGSIRGDASNDVDGWSGKMDE